MSMYEVELRQQVETQFGSLSQRMSLVIFDQYHKLLDYLYSFLKHSQNLIRIDQNSKKNVAYLQSKDESEVRIHLSKTELTALHQLQQGRVKIGKVGEYDIYFDLHSTKIFSFDYSKRVLNEPLESNAVLDIRYQQAFGAIEQMGQIIEVVVNRNNSAITLTLKNGLEKIIKPGDAYFEEISGIFSGRLIEIGKVVTDELMYSNSIGFFNGNTARPIQSLEAVITFINPIAEEAIRLSKGKLKTAVVDEENDPVVIDFLGTEVVIRPDEKLHHLMLQIQKQYPVMVGRCEGRHKVYYSWKSGPLVKSDFRSDRAVYEELDKLHNIKNKITPYLHIFYEASNPGELAVINPYERVKKVQFIRPDDPMFSIFLKLVQGQVGIFPTSDNSDFAYTVVYNTEQGLIFDKQPADELAQALIQLHSVYFDLNLGSITEPRQVYPGPSKNQLKKRRRTMRALEKNKKLKKRTQKEKRRAERNNLPKK